MGEVPLERTELLVPVRLELVESRLERQHGFAPQAEDAHTRIAGGALVGYEAGLEQNPQVPAHHRRGRPGGRGQLAGPTLSVAEKLELVLSRLT